MPTIIRHPSSIAALNILQRDYGKSAIFPEPRVVSTYHWISEVVHHEGQHAAKGSSFP
jgi:hypothetical protein